MTDVIVKTKLHEAWAESGHEERSLFMQDIVFFYRALLVDLLNQTKGAKYEQDSPGVAF